MTVATPEKSWEQHRAEVVAEVGFYRPDRDHVQHQGMTRRIELDTEVRYQVREGYPVQTGRVVMTGGVSNGQPWVGISRDDGVEERVWVERVEP